SAPRSPARGLRWGIAPDAPRPSPPRSRSARAPSKTTTVPTPLRRAGPHRSRWAAHRLPPSLASARNAPPIRGYIRRRGRPNRPAMFGKHLVERGLLRESELIEALDRQASMRVSIGRLAYQMRLMTMDQVMKVLEAQRSNPQRFGALAVELGFLTVEQLESLLESQRGSRIPLGQVLAS